MLMKRNMKTLLLLAAAAVVMLSATALAADGRLELLPRNATWKYLDDGVDLGQYWAEKTDPSGWKEGPAPLGFGDDISETDPTLPLATEVSFGDNENDKHMTTYVMTEAEFPPLKALRAWSFISMWMTGLWYTSTARKSSAAALMRALR